MSRCVKFPPLWFVWNGVSGNDLVELLQVRREKVEAEKESKKAKRQQKFIKHEHIEYDMQKENKKRRIEDKDRCGYQHTRKTSSHVKGLELEQTERKLKELLENWVPPPIQSQQTEFDDLHWLFDTRVPTRQTTNTTTATIYAMPLTLLV